MNHKFEFKDFCGATVVIASPSAGNVGQLSMDLIISTLKATKVGMIWHEGILPMGGADPYRDSSSELCTSNDYYYAKNEKLLLGQLRAPVLRAHFKDYCSKLVELLKSFGVARLIILAGMSAHQRDDSELRAGTFRYLANGKENSFQEHGWNRIKGNDAENNFRCPVLPGSGFTRILFDCCNELPCSALLYFCSEGDNIEDAVELTKKTNQLLNFVSDNNFIHPPSWKFLFGNLPPPDMF